ncbi:MAG TPA: CHAT domain-containing tetratricopeptide repeat protein, partial [Blastocatellia bacterium]|nr:CHAT domain-containing tetratricopeptide repeat protein [Blastocatellia bacterium]
GNLDAAEDYYRRTLSIRERVAPESLDTGGSYLNLGVVAADRGDVESARLYYTKALAIFERVAPNSLAVASAVNNLGIVERELGNLKDSEDDYRKALAIRERLAPDSLDVSGTLLNLGRLFAARGDLRVAREYFTRSLTIRERRAPNSLDVALSLNNLGAVGFDAGDLDGAEDLYRRAFAIRSRLAPDSLAEAESLTNLGNLAFRRGRLIEARSLFSKAVAIIEEQRSPVAGMDSRALLIARNPAPFAGLIRALVALGDNADALSALERFRARSLVEMLAERRVSHFRNAPADLLKQEGDLQRKRSVAYATLAKLDSRKDSALIEQIQPVLKQYDVEHRELESKIRRASPEFARLRYPQPLNADGVRAALDPGSLLLAYFVDKKQTYMFAVTNDNLSVFTLPVKLADLSNDVAEFRDAVATQRLGMPLSTTHELGRKLYGILIAPAQQMVGSTKRILICPDGPLQTLPFAALVSRTTPEVRYLIDDKPLQTIVSMTVYAETREWAAQHTVREKRVLAFGDPVYTKDQADKLGTTPRRSLGRSERPERDSDVAYLRNRGVRFDVALPQTRKEVEGIARVFGKSATIRLAEQATETAAKLESRGFSVVHFAVHGWLDDRIGLNSGLLLTRPDLLGKESTEDDNGLLQAWEILERVRLNADLVVLSACETGLGKELRGEGLIGLTRAFQYAGAKSVVVSLWEVSDESTAALMSAFYRELQKGKGKDVALQRATAAVRKTPKWRHPFYWAPFILVGDWK